MLELAGDLTARLKALASAHQLTQPDSCDAADIVALATPVIGLLNAISGAARLRPVAHTNLGRGHGHTGSFNSDGSKLVFSICLQDAARGLFRRKTKTLRLSVAQDQIASSREDPRALLHDEIYDDLGARMNDANTA